MRTALAAALLASIAACGGDDSQQAAPAEVDADGDGSVAAVDCDDHDASSHPGAAERCDGRDNDCNGVVDDDATDGVVRYPDSDGDGWGADAGTVASCDEQAGWVDRGGDCDDDDAAVHSGAVEICNGRDDDCDGAVDEGIPTDGAGCTDPGPPDFPDVIGILTVAIRTGDGATDGTDANGISLCLNETACFELAVADVDDFRVGEFDVFHVEGLSLPRAEVDRVQIVSTNGTDRWVPSCMEIQFDGEPVYCQPNMGMFFGNAAGELGEWTDPDGLHLGCVTCYPTPLTHGPMVGAVEPDQARLWLRTDATRRVSVRVGDDAAALGASQPVAFVYPEASRDYAAVVDVSGLEPATTYFYQLEVEGEATETHSFRTAPEPGKGGALRFAFGSCTRDDAQPIFAQVQAQAPDLFLFIGDAHYGNTDDLGGLRWNYRWGLERPPRAALLAATPTIAVWDDHDYTGNNTDGTAPGKDVALRVFDEYWANPGAGTAATPGVFFAYRWGDVELFMLDDRYYRDLDGTLLGDAQTQWLEQKLAASSATFKFLVSGSQFTSFGSNDSWAAFPAARDALFDYIRDQKIDGVVLMSGDIHRSELRLIERSSAGAYDLPELTSSPMANTNSTCQADGELQTCVDDDDFFIVVDVDTSLADPTLRARIVDTQGAERADWTLALSNLSM